MNHANLDVLLSSELEKKKWTASEVRTGLDNLLEATSSEGVQIISPLRGQGGKQFACVELDDLKEFIKRHLETEAALARVQRELRLKKSEEILTRMASLYEGTDQDLVIEREPYKAPLTFD